MVRFLRLTFGTAAAGVLALGGLGGLNLYTYERFTQERIIATLDFEVMDGRRYQVHWQPEAGSPASFELEGDEWQLDVRVIKWTDWLTFLGEEPLYRLDRISGRFVDLDEAKGRRSTMHALSPTDGFDLWAFARKEGNWLPGVDAAYGSSVYLPMADGARYEVSISRTGLLARSLPAVKESR